MQENWQDNWQTCHQLNAQGLRSHTQLPDGSELNYHYDEQGRTSDGKQMNDKWVNDKRLDNAGMTRKQQRKVLSSLRDGDGKVEKLLIRNKADGSLVVKKLDADAKIASSGLELNF